MSKYKKGAIMTQEPLLSQYLNFVSNWEKDNNTCLSFKANLENTVKISQVISILKHPRTASGPGLCYNLSVLEQFLKTQKIIEDRNDLEVIQLNHPTKMKIFMYCRGKIKHEEPA